MMPHHFQTLSLSTEGHLATVTLNRPAVRNAFNEQLIAELTTTFRVLADARDIRAIVLTGNGPTFCAGADLNWMKKIAGYSHDENLADAMRLAEMLRTIHTCPKPVIARVQGDAYAGGMGLIAACDIAIAADSASFCLSEARLGLLPATISPYVIKATGEQAARRYFVTAERFNAHEALRIGFVHELAGAKSLDARVADVAHAILDNSPNAVRECKQLVQQVGGRAIDDALIADTALRIAHIRASDEGREGMSAFLEKRRPGWLPATGH